MFATEARRVSRAALFGTPAAGHRRAADPILSGELGRRAARTIGTILRTLLAILPVLAVLTLFSSSRSESLAVGGLLAAVAALYALQRAGRPAATIYALVGALIVYGIVAVLAFGSIRSIGVLAFVGAVVIGGIFLGRNALIAVVALCAGALGALVYAETAGWLAQPNYAVGATHWAVHCAVIGAIALNVYYARTLVVDALLRAQESEERLSKLFRSNPAVLLTTALDSGRIIDVNEGFERVFGIRRAESLGSTTIKLGLWNNPADREVFLDRVRSEGRVVNMPVTLRRRSGEVFPGLLSAEVLEVGDVHQILTTATDISELVRTRAALHATEERLARIFRASPAAIIVTDFETREFISANAAAERMFKSRSGEVAGTRLGSRFYADPRDQDMLRERLVAEGRVEGAEVRLLRGDGERFEARVSQETLEESGARYTITVVEDVSVERAAREALKASEERFADAFRLNPIGMAITRLSDGRYVDLSTGSQNALGYSREESIGRSAIEMDIWATRDDRARFLGTLRADKRVAAYEARMRNKSGELVDCMIWAALVEFDGEPCVLSSTVNVTEQKRQEAMILSLNESLERRVTERTAQLEAANKELEAFSFSVSHDLRAPLRAIDGFTRILAGQHGAVDESMRTRSTERVLAGVKRMNELIDDLLSLARVSAQDLDCQPVDLTVLAREVVEAQRELEPARSVEASIAATPMAQCDRAMMRIVLENLVGNAWKFTGKRELARVEFGSFGGDAGQTTYFVRDNGAGFDPQYSDRLFAPFQRLHDEREFEGTGVGLATVKRVVVRHGGRVWAASEPDKGATFYFTCEAA